VDTSVSNEHAASTFKAYFNYGAACSFETAISTYKTTCHLLLFFFFLADYLMTF
jgi:hypothetical protein